MTSRRVQFKMNRRCSDGNHDSCSVTGSSELASTTPLSHNVYVCSCECHYTHNKEKLAQHTDHTHPVFPHILCTNHGYVGRCGWCRSEGAIAIVYFSDNGIPLCIDCTWSKEFYRAVKQPDET